MNTKYMIKKLLLTGWDCASWLVAVALVVLGRFDLTLTQTQWASVLAYAAGVCTLQVIVGFLMKMYLGRFRTGSFDEMPVLVLSTVIVGVFTGGLFLGLARNDSFPRSVAILAPPIALMFMATGRWAYLDVALFVALVGFLGSVAFARYVERMNR